METRFGLLSKLGVYTVIAVGLVVVGKQHIASHKDKRHLQEFNQEISELEFANTSVRPGFPANNPNLNYESSSRESTYVGLGASYATRTKGDRLSMWNVIKARHWDGDRDEK